MNYRKKIIAAFMVLAMLAVCIVPFSESSDATDDVLESLDLGSWTWNTTTGLGPFNSYYAAFDIDNGNRFVSVLNPMDLSKQIDGTSLGPGNYNIMWVLPTVYWKVDANGDLTLTNDSTAGGTAYAHTIDGHVYNYIAYGVYEATSDNNSTPTKLTSESGKMPLVSKTRAQFRDLADNYTMDSSLGSNAYSMLWNFYMWELYKYCSLATMEDFNSQKIVGYGHTWSSVYAVQTGSLDAYGPYAGMVSDEFSATTGDASAKLFLENTWGGVNDFVDGVVIVGSSDFYIDSSHNPTDATSTGTYVISKNIPLSSGNGYPTTISTDPAIWGYGTNMDGSADVGLSDKVYAGSNSTTSYVLNVGGCAYESEASLAYGLCCARGDYFLSTVNINGSRLAFVFDADAASISGTQNYSYTLDYTAADMATTSAAISVANMNPITHDAPLVPTTDVTITLDGSQTGYGTINSGTTDIVVSGVEEGSAIAISDNVLTVGGTTITATPSSTTAQYTFGWDGFYDGSTKLSNGDLVTTDMVITAKFTATLNQYTVTITAGPGGSVDVPSVTADYGSSITVNDNVVTIGSTPVTATPSSATAQYTYAFDEWGNASGTVTADRTITASFTSTVNSYTITWSINGVDTTEEYEYGDTPSHADPSITGYTFEGWDPEISTVVADQTYTAILDPIEYTVTFDAQGGTVDPASAVGSIDDPIALPTPTKQFYSFDGWYDAATEGTLVSSPYTPTADITLYAYWSEVEYTITFDANGGTVDTATLTGSPITAVTLPRALQSGFYFAGWYTAASEGELVALAGALMYPTEDVTYYAQYSDAKVYFNGVSFNNNGGYGAPGPLSHTAASKGSYDFTIPETVPVLDGKTFRGWAKTSTESAKYQPGDTISVAADAQVTLYAIWEDQQNTNETLLSLIPLLIVIATVMIAATAAFKFRDGDYMGIIYLVIGIVVIIMLLTMFVIPVINEV